MDYDGKGVPCNRPYTCIHDDNQKKKKKQQQQQNGSKSTNQYPNLIEVNVCFLEGPLLWFMGRIRVLLAGAVYTRPFL